MASSALFSLPIEVLWVTLSGCSAYELARVEQVCRGAKTILECDDTSSLWANAARGAWSPAVQMGTHRNWRAAAINLEVFAWPLLRDVGVKAALRYIRANKFLAQPEPGSSKWATQESLDIIRSSLRHRKNIDCRRRVALFACSSDFAGAPALPTNFGGDKTLDSSEHGNLWDVLSLFKECVHRATDPENALRLLLLRFPFLPIDAGEGADRVIWALARLYLKLHPSQFAHLRRREEGKDHEDAESAVYILIYAVIMLNTDLHHPAIKNKMTADEFLRSARSTVLEDAVSDADLRRIYASVASKQLLICAPQQQRTLSNLLDAGARQAASHKPAPTNSFGSWAGHWKLHYPHSEAYPLICMALLLPCAVTLITTVVSYEPILAHVWHL